MALKGDNAMLKLRSAVTKAAAVCAMLCLAVLAACGGGGAGGGGGSASEELRIGLQPFTPTFNPATGQTGEGAMFSSLAYASLTHQEGDGSITPGLAESWKYVGDGSKVFELTLRKNLKFADGSTLDAAAVKKWLDYIAAANSPTAATVGAVKSVEAVDDLTVRITLVEPNPTLPVALSEAGQWGKVVSPAAVDNPDLMKEKTAGAGPYILSDFVEGDHYNFVPNENFYDQDAIHYKKVTVRLFQEPTTALQAIKSGQADVIQGDYATVEEAKASGLEVAAGVESTGGLAFMDLTGELFEPLADVRVRQALNYAIDREKITEGLFPGGYSEPTSEMFSQDGFVDELQDHYSYDPEKAKSLLAEAGYPDGFTFNVFANTSIQQGEPLARAIAQQLSDIGVTLEVTPAGANFFDLFTSKKYSTVMLMQNNPWWLIYQYYFAPTGFFNQHGFVDSELDAMWASASAAEQPTDQWADLASRAVEQAYFLPTNTVSRMWYYDSDRVAGITPSNAAPNPWPATWHPAED